MRGCWRLPRIHLWIIQTVAIVRRPHRSSPGHEITINKVPQIAVSRMDDA
jgi:hypothetical protein